MAVGIKANAQIAKDAGLEVNRGIVVDDGMRTSDPDIYAIGGLAFYLLTGQSPHDSSSLLDTVADEDLILPNTPVTPAEAKLVAVAKLAMKKAVNRRPHSVSDLVPLLVD